MQDGAKLHADLHDLLGRFAEFGKNAAGGVCRLTGSPADGAARHLFAEEAIRRGADLHVDEIGNMFASFRIAPESDTAVLVGSHLDSQPTGGRYDGAYGVLAGLVAAQAIASDPGMRPAHNLTVVNWTNEEGARFQPSLTGSSVFVGALPLDKALSLQDRLGITLGDALLAIGFAGAAPYPLQPVRYVELHIEQGDRLEASGRDIGLVRAAWSARKLTVQFVGETSHTGPTPMHKRRDALRAAAVAITTLYAVVETPDIGLHASAARMEIHPDSPNVVPSHVTVWFEIRHPDMAVATEAGDRFLREIAASLAAKGIEICILVDEKRANTPLDPGLVEIVRAAALETGKSVLDLETVAGHDALALQKRIASALIFVPSVDGLSHNEREYTAPADLDNGLDVLVETLKRLLILQ